MENVSRLSVVAVVAVLAGCACCGSEGESLLGEKLEKASAEAVTESAGLPVLELSADVWRQTFVAQGTKETYEGHPTTLLSDDQRTMFCIWTSGHGGVVSRLARSDDGGRSWTRIDELLPKGYVASNLNCPTFQKIKGSDGKTRYFAFSCKLKPETDASGRKLTKPERLAGLGILMSEDEGETWRELPSQPHLSGGKGQCRVHLLKHHGKSGRWPGNEVDTGYPGVELLPDGTIVCTTYTIAADDGRQSSVVSMRLNVKELTAEPVAQKPALVLRFDDMAAQPSLELLRAQARETAASFVAHGLPPPKTWIRPGGWEDPVDWRRMKAVYGDEFGYKIVDSTGGEGLEPYSTWNYRSDFGFFDFESDVEKVYSKAAAALEGGHSFAYISHQWTKDRAKYLGLCRQLAAKLKANGVRLTTYSHIAE